MVVIIISFEDWLSWIILFQLVVQLVLVDDCSVLDVQWVKPFEEDQKIHPSEKTEENNESGEDFADKNSPVAEVDGVGTFDNDSKTHMEHTKDDRKFHFDVVSVSKTVLGLAPSEILSNH